MPAFWPLPLKLKPETGEHRVDVVFLGLEEMFLDRLGHFERAAHRGAGRQRELHHDLALILGGQEAGRQSQQQQRHHGHDGAERQHALQRALDDLENAVLVTVARRDRTCG